MQLDYNGNKGFRLLSIYEMLNKGERLSKVNLALQFGVTEKTIQRDIDDLRAYLADTHFSEGEVSIQYDRVRCGYYLVRMEREWFTNEEVLAICKVLLESRAFCKDELNALLSKLLMRVTPTDRKQVENMIRSEQFCYVPLRHGKKVISTLWELSQYITRKEIIQIAYCRMNGTNQEHEIKPVAIMFSEYYFYLIAFMADDSKEYPTVFRVDRLEVFQGTGNTFNIPYRDRFNDGEFRKRVQFMYSGELQKVKFEYFGPSIEAVLDRLPKSVAYMPLCNFANNFNLNYCLHKNADLKSNCPLHKNCKRQLAIIEIHKKIEEKQAEIKAEMERYQSLCKNL